MPLLQCARDFLCRFYFDPHTILFSDPLLFYTYKDRVKSGEYQVLLVPLFQIMVVIVNYVLEDPAAVKSVFVLCVIDILASRIFGGLIPASSSELCIKLMFLLGFVVVWCAQLFM